MQTIAYIDRADKDRVFKYYGAAKRRKQLDIFPQKKADRIKEALYLLRGMANIDIYLIKGSKHRKIITRAWEGYNNG